MSPDQPSQLGVKHLEVIVLHCLHHLLQSHQTTRCSNNQVIYNIYWFKIQLATTIIFHRVLNKRQRGFTPRNTNKQEYTQEIMFSEALQIEDNNKTA